MPWNKRACRFLHTHWVFKQEGDESCGPSCGAMIVERLRGVQLKANETYTGMSGYGLQKKVGSYDASTRPTNGAEMARYLKMLLGQNVTYYRPQLPSAVKRGVVPSVAGGIPVVMGVMWNGAHGTMGADGGHWVVVDRLTQFARQTYACICDPGDGHVHVAKWTDGTSLTYKPSYSDGGGQLDDYLLID